MSRVGRSVQAVASSAQREGSAVLEAPERTEGYPLTARLLAGLRVFGGWGWRACAPPRRLVPRGLRGTMVPWVKHPRLRPGLPAPRTRKTRSLLAILLNGLILKSHPYNQMRGSGFIKHQVSWQVSWCWDRRRSGHGSRAGQLGAEFQVLVSCSVQRSSRRPPHCPRCPPQRELATCLLLLRGALSSCVP